MPRLPLPAFAASLAAATLLAVTASSASAATYCVSTASTDGCGVTDLDGATPGAQLQAALTLAANDNEDDVIRLGPGTYDQQKTFVYQKTDTETQIRSLTIEADTPGTVTLADTGTTADDETVELYQATGDVTIRDLTIEGPPNAARSLGLEAGTEGAYGGARLVRVHFVAPATTTKADALQNAVLSRGKITLQDSTVSGFKGGLITHALTTSGTSTNIGTIVAERTSVVVSGAALDVAGATTNGPTTIGTATLSDVLLQSSGAGPVFVVGCRGQADLRYVTLGRTAASSSPGVSGGCVTSGRTAKATIADSILVPGTSITWSGGSANTLAIARSRWDGPASVNPVASPGTAGTVSYGSSGLPTAAPGFVSASDWHLASGSPLIDANAVQQNDDLNAAPYSGGDLDGASRVVDGNGDGSAAPDLGAYEFQPAPPATPTPAPTPQVTPVPTPVLIGDPGPPATPVPTPTPQPQTVPTRPSTFVPLPTGPAAFAGAKLTAKATKLDSKGRLGFRVACPEASIGRCTGTVQLLRVTGKGKQQKSTVLGSAKVAITAGKGATLRITPKLAVRRTLARSGGSFTLRAKVRDGRSGGAIVTTTATLKVRAG